MKKEEINQFLEKLMKNQRFLLCLHENVDTDSLCSNIAMAEILTFFQKDVTIILGKNVKFPKEFNAFGDWLKIISNNEVKDLDLTQYDCFLMLDSSSEDRLHDMGEFMTLPKFVIDHHSGNNIVGAIASLIDPICSSTAEMIYEIGEHYFKNQSPNMFGGDYLLAIYMGILSDTMCLKYRLSQRTFEILSTILKYIDPNPCFMLYEKSWKEDDFSMIRIGMNNLYTLSFDNKKVGLCVISRNDLRRGNYIDEDTSTDSLIQLFEKSKEIEILIIANEDYNEKNQWRIRTRSYVDGSHARIIAEKLGGSGHDKMAGAKLLDVNSDNILDTIKTACS